MDKRRKNCSQDDLFKILDAIELAQNSKNKRKTVYVPKNMYKIAKKMVKIEGKASDMKIKTY